MALPCFLLSNRVHAQNYVENFESTAVGALPTGWTVSSNTDAAVYVTPIKGCNVNNKGLQTPGVGSTAPVKLLLPSQTFNSSTPNVSITFGIYVLDATLKCTSMKDFPCATYVKAYLVKSTFNSLNSDPTASEMYAEQPNYQVVNANGLNTVVF
jgi:hypothetical protein